MGFPFHVRGRLTVIASSLAALLFVALMIDACHADDRPSSGGPPRALLRGKAMRAVDPTREIPANRVPPAHSPPPEQESQEQSSTEKSPDRTSTAKRPVEEATPEIKAVIEKLKSSDAKTRAAACAALVIFQPTLPRTAADALVDVINNDSEASVRFEAVTHLCEFLSDGEHAVPKLLKLLADPSIDDPLRINTCYSLGFVGVYDKDIVADALADQLDSKQASPQAKCVAAQSLGLIGAETEKALDALFQHLDAPESYVDSTSQRKCVLGDLCLETFSKTRRPYSKAVPALIKKIEGGNLNAVNAAAKALKNMGPASGEAVPALMVLFQSGKPFLRSIALSTLEAIGPPASKEIPTFRKAFEAENTSAMRNVLMRTMISVGRNDASEVVPLLMKWVNEPDQFLNNAAMQGLIALGPEAKQALPMMQSIMENSNNRRRRAVARTAVESIVGIDGLRTFIKMLSDNDEDERRRAYAALIKIGPPAKDALPILRDLAKEEIVAIATLGPVGGEEAVPDLAEHLKRDNYEIAEAAALSLMAAGESAKAAIPNLQAVAKDRELKTALRMTALKAISRIQNPQPK